MNINDIKQKYHKREIDKSDIENIIRTEEKKFLKIQDQYLENNYELERLLITKPITKPK